MSIHRLEMPSFSHHPPVTAPPMMTHFHQTYPAPPDRSHAEDMRMIPSSSQPSRPSMDTGRRRSDIPNGEGGRGPGRITRPTAPTQLPPQDAPSPQPTASTSKKNQTAASTSQSADSPPAVLVREKKQKACANCRKAKLKCMMDEGQADCVRCRARKEKCVFYPRSHDEDWQQTMTTDVYAAINHMSRMSRAVHHILHHLTRERIIPALPEPFEVFNPVERDLAVLQGWNGEKNQVLPEKPKGDGKRKRAEEEDTTARRESFSTEQAPTQASSQHIRRPTLMSEASDPIYPIGDYDANRFHSSPENPLRPPIPMLAHERSRFQSQLHTELAPFQPLPRIPVQLTPTSELEVTQPDAPMIHLGSWSGKSASSTHLPLPPPIPMPLAYPPSTLMAPAPSVPPPMPSPQNFQQATPASIPISSPVSMPAKTPGEWNATQSSSTKSDAAPIDQSLAEALRNLPAPDVSQQIQTVDLDEDGDEIYGTADGRQTIISKKLIPAKTAKILVQYFHANISPHLFGYNLQLRHFPYLADGPRSITPFILAVECLLASERISELFSYHASLADEVLAMLMHSPAESWQTFESSKEKGPNGQEGSNKTIDDVRLGPALEMVDDTWDPELGIGPEEIVAVCALASFISQREEAKMIATYAFTWAKGWTKYIQAPRNTFAEMAGLVSALRMPTQQEMARVWLLSYISLGQEMIVSNSYESISDPLEWCKAILPDLDHPSPACAADPHDILLVCHSRLLVVLFRWLKDRLEMPRRTDPSSNVSAIKRLSQRTNQHLDWWVEDLRAYNMEPSWTQQIMLDWLHAKTLVNSLLFKNMWGGSDEDRLREQSRGVAVDSAVQFLRRAVAWDRPKTISQLPNVYYRMIALVAGETVEALLEVAQGTFSPMACPTSVEEMMQVMASLSQLLAKGGVQEGHYCRETARTLRQHVENLSRLLPH